MRCWQPYIMNLLCQGAGGLWTGLGGPHLVVGRLLLGHTVRQERAGGGRQVIIRTEVFASSAGLLGQTPSHVFRSCGVGVCRFGGRRIV